MLIRLVNHIHITLTIRLVFLLGDFGQIIAFLHGVGLSKPHVLQVSLFHVQLGRLPVCRIIGDIKISPGNQL